MGMSDKLAAAALGAATTYLAQRGIRGAWTTVTGEQPPDPHDPATPTVLAVSWLVASGLGLALVQLLVSRHASQRYHAPAKRVRLML